MPLQLTVIKDISLGFPLHDKSLFQNEAKSAHTLITTSGQDAVNRDLDLQSCLKQTNKDKIRETKVCKILTDYQATKDSDPRET